MRDPIVAPGQEIALRAVGTALAGMAIAFAVYMLAYGGGKARINGLEHLAIFAQPRGAAGAPFAPSRARVDAAETGALDMAATASLATPLAQSAPEQPIEIVAARPDRVWLRVNGALRSAAPGDDVPGLGHIGAIVARGGGWAVLNDAGAALLTLARTANGAALFTRDRIFE